MVSETLREITPGLDDGKYTIVSTLKEGRLYLAEKAGKRFVLKTSPGAKGLEMLKREYTISLALPHPFIASAVAWEENTPVGPAIVMEYIRGRNLSEYLKEKPSFEARKRIFGQLLEAVGAIHRQSIIHNDLKPENILITEADNDLKLIDFGFADNDAHILEKGLGGTRQYASPELLAHQLTDARSDIYSIGRLMQDIFPGRYRSIVRRCLRQSPDRRYPSVRALEKALVARRRLWTIAPAALAVTLVLLPYFLIPRSAQAPYAVGGESDSLRAVVDSLQEVIRGLEEDKLAVDSLQGVIQGIEKEKDDMETALKDAKARVDAVYARIIPQCCEAIRKAQTIEEVNEAYLRFLEQSKEVNFEIPEKCPESIRPALREYILTRNAPVSQEVGTIMIQRQKELSRSQ